MDRSSKSHELMKKMRSLKEREKSYHDYPRSATQQPKQLAAAGFFYTGKTDEVTCPFCHGTVNEWEEEDVPMDEHKKHFPSCSFMKSNYVGGAPSSGRTEEENVADSSVPMSRRNPSQAQEKHNTTTTSHNPTNNGASDTTTSNTGLGASKFKVEARDLRARMERPMVRKFLDMGFDFDVMKKVMFERLVTNGEDFEKAEDFAVAIMDHEDKIKKAAAGNSSEKCRTCKNREADTMFLPCGHTIFCHKCALEPNFCQECGARIKGTKST